MNRITAIFFEETSKGNKIDYSTIRTRIEQEEKELPVDKIGKEKSDSDDKSSSAMERAEPNSTYAESIQLKETSMVEQKRSKRNKTAVLDFSGIKGAYILPYEFRAKEFDVCQDQQPIAKESSAHERQHVAEPCSAKDEHQDDGARDSKEEILEGCDRAKQDVIQIIQPSCFSNIFKKVHLIRILPIPKSGHRFIIDALFSKFCIRNLERPIEEGDLLISNQIIRRHIGQHVMPSREADNADLSNSKVFPLCYSNFISTWLAFMLLYSVCTWSE
jgi:hypothetical protein